MALLYSDKLVEITDEGLTLRRYGVLRRPKHIALSRITHVEELQPALADGRWGVGGSGKLSPWFPRGWERPCRDRIYVIVLRAGWKRHGFTVEDADLARSVLLAKGLLRGSRHAEDPPAPIVLRNQRFIAGEVPERGGASGETERLRAALCGTYECMLHQTAYRFSGAVLRNEDLQSATDPDHCSGQAQFNVSEVAKGPEHTLTLESLAGCEPLGSLELTPLDWNDEPLDFDVVETGPARRVIRYVYGPHAPVLKIEVSDVNVVDVASLRFCAWPDGMPAVRFHEPVSCSLGHPGPFDIDLLDAPASAAEPRALHEHLQALFAAVFGGKAHPARLLALECSGRYRLAAQLPEISLPVLSIPATRYDPELSRKISVALKTWYQSAGPRVDTFAFALRVLTDSDRPRPLLSLGELRLPIASIADVNNGCE